MKFNLPFDDQTISLEIPEDNLLNFVEANISAQKTNNSQLLSDAVNNPEASVFFEYINGKKLMVLIEDSTREVPLANKLDVILKKLHRAGEIQFIIATGTHEVDTAGNAKIIKTIKEKADSTGIHVQQIIIHDCRKADFISVGETDFGNEILVNKVIMDADFYLVFSDIKNHYFAGYSNPFKNFLPGVCKFESIERNHAHALKDESTYGTHPLHPDPNKQNNPLSNEIYQAFKLITAGKPVYTLASISVKKNILWTGFGPIEEITTEGILKCDQLMSKTVNPADFLIVSSGGFPNDESLYHAQRALELTKQAVKDGGDILFVAGCRFGIGPPETITNFFEPLKKDLDQIITDLNTTYIMYSHKTYKFARLIQKTGNIFIYSKLQKEIVESVHLRSTAEPQQIVDNWLKKNPDAKINIFTQGNKVAAIAKKQR